MHSSVAAYAIQFANMNYTLQDFPEDYNFTTVDLIQLSNLTQPPGG